jgi:hypothetical protein
MARTPPRVLVHEDFTAAVGGLLDAQVLHQRALGIPDRDERNFTLGRAYQRMREAQIVLCKAGTAREKAA